MVGISVIDINDDTKMDKKSYMGSIYGGLLPQDIGKDLPKIAITAQDDESLATWTNFTQNTSFHGIKYIFVDSPIRLRR